MGKNRVKEQIRQSYAEYQRGKVRKATDFLAELKKPMPQARKGK